MNKVEQDHLNYNFLLASEAGILDDVKLLLNQGAYVHVKGNQALLQATLMGHFEIVKYLLEKGADIHDPNNNSLFNASHYGRLEMVKYFVIEHNCSAESALEKAKGNEYKLNNDIVEWCEKYIERKKLKNTLGNELNSNKKLVNKKKI